MSQTIKGVAEFDARPNAGGFWSVKVDGVYYGTGKASPNVSKGDYITFQAKQNAKGYWDADPKSIKKGGGDATAVNGAGQAAVSSAAYGNREESKQRSISWQAARNSAIEFMKILGERGGLPAAAAKAKAADNFEVLGAILNELTQEFYDQSQSPASKAAPSPPRAGKAPVDTSEAEAGGDDPGWEG